ncbi:DUF2383 domain-containing protein [Flavisericum labens]|uniref:DUF2383 domain-containing protein n=1 Tax=Flavisericum labens TaxID=3377112 RepID=UPI00387AE50C
MKNDIEYILTSLIKKTSNTGEAFRKAAKQISNTSLKSYFKLKAQERNNFEQELETELQALNENLNKNQTDSSRDTKQPTWVNFDAIALYSQEELILEEVINGERAALDEYTRLIRKAQLPLRTKSILNSQKNKIQRGLSTIKTFEELY